jgi:RNA recognition motif-containing protein
VSTRLYVGNFSLNTTEDDLAQAFGQDSRRVTNIRIITWRIGINCRHGFAFVGMATEADARSAIEALDGSEFNGRTLRVDEVQKRKSRDNGGGSRNRARRRELKSTGLVKVGAPSLFLGGIGRLKRVLADGEPLQATEGLGSGSRATSASTTSIT